ncbi:hypothetical protein D6Z43_16320 [Pseudomonas sp. DY-1]|uniref:PA0613 family protein n=1 Tax=Pseudomonas sp. DY-1 TaxID=1755504 RepID=UPI000EA84794|nr:hypothetical protein [Pseudomonas sp. DY-1]AYF88636.1 hypothetical protein D6Z43_16320 [Pseudomonas sp. DY-1]
MIDYIDEALRLWAAELHGPEPGGDFGGGGGSMIATLIANKGELIRCTRGSRVLLDRAAEIELIVNKHLPVKEHQVVIEHYTNYDSRECQKWEACGCSRPQYYRRLHDAHVSIEDQLIRRRAA